MFSEKQEAVIKAYFMGGNAKEKSTHVIKQDLEMIIQVIKEENNKPGA